MIADSNNIASFQNWDNIFDALITVDERNAASLGSFQQALSANESGYLKFQNQETKYLYYRPTGINDWYLLTVVPAKIVDSKMNLVVNRTLALSLILCLLFTFLLITIMRMRTKTTAN